MTTKEYWHNRGSSDRTAGRANANSRLFDTPWTAEGAEAYQEGWDHTSGQIDKTEGRLN